MTTKRVDKLQPGERVRYQHAVWTVTRVRPGARPNSRDVRLRAVAEPHETVEPLLPNDCIVEVISE